MAFNVEITPFNLSPQCTDTPFMFNIMRSNHFTDNSSETNVLRTQRDLYNNILTSDRV